MLILFKTFRKLTELTNSTHNYIDSFNNYKAQLLKDKNNYILNKINNITDMNKAQDDFTLDIKININKIDSKDKKPILIDELYSSDEENEDFLNENEITELLNESKNKNIANLFKQENDDSFIINKKDNMTLFSKTFNKYDYIKNWNKQIKDFNSTITKE